MIYFIFYWLLRALRRPVKPFGSFYIFQRNESRVLEWCTHTREGLKGGKRVMNNNNRPLIDILYVSIVTALWLGSNISAGRCYGRTVVGLWFPINGWSALYSRPTCFHLTIFCFFLELFFDHFWSFFCSFFLNFR